ncbi:type II toxin-antitoxin system RelE family toxin [Aliarcobacter cryaerophilus]|uniref:type II toxin-antitoxin system RelE family toxin n=1 Tax=Aliarcobacter cryaerophilus TaxID=28198 RepID=UPI0021B56A84|nr:type II toxin-antitoxin system RelE/ParE family toxin [Aliarcobacter cryaerophilus]MCT7496254.1 type II toxin-antitoxin system RelE/ParE family toxin [Aliarcobacter cryaerophilus]
MDYRLILKKSVIKFVEKRNQKDRENINSKFKILKNNPYPNSLLDIKKLANSSFYRLRINNYRFVYEILDDELVILMIDANNRGDIY